MPYSVKFAMKFPIYLDNHATTRVDPRVLERMLPLFGEQYGNAASRSHAFGWQAEELLEVARGQVAATVGASATEILFTSGATEANNLAILGAAEAYGSRGKHIITQVTEHKAVLDVCHHLETRGFRVTFLPVDVDGLVTVQAVEAAMEPDTILVAVMAANNEIGTVQPIRDIGKLCHKRGVLFHCDAAQAVGRIPLDVQADSIDLLSLSGHKIYGPKGIGALYVRRRDPRVILKPFMFGGGHERGLRPGTVNTPGAVALGAACALTQTEGSQESQRVTALRDRLRERITSALDDVRLNGHGEKRLPGNLSLSFGGVDGEALMLSLRDVAVSGGSACTSATLAPSYVLLALGLTPERCHSTLRFGVGRFNTVEEIDYVAAQVVEKVSKLRTQNPRANNKMRTRPNP